MTGAWNKVVFACERQKARVEANQVAVVFGYSCREIVEPQFAGTPTQGFKSVEVTAHEGLEALAVGELQIHLAAVALHQAERIQFARSTVIKQRAEVPPINREARTGAGFHAHVGATLFGLAAYGLQVVFEDGDAAVIAEGLQMLQQHWRGSLRVFFE